MKVFDVIVWILLMIGGLNWGLVGFFDFNLVNAIFGSYVFWPRLIYALVGLAALYDIFWIKAIWRRWSLPPSQRPAHV